MMEAAFKDKVDCAPGVVFVLMGCRGKCDCGWLGTYRVNVGPALRDAEKHSGKKWVSKLAASPVHRMIEQGEESYD